MASSAAVHSSTPNMGSGPNARWGVKSMDPGTAFSGLSRGGRGRGGSRGGARGGRGGGRGGFRGGKPQADTIHEKSDSTPPKTDSPVTEKSTSSTIPKTPPVEKPKEASTGPTKPKPPSRRASRNVPALTIASIPTTEAPPNGRSPNRRKRASTNGKSPASAGPKSGPHSIDEAHLHPGSKARLDGSAAIKDAPPHLRPSHDVRSDIDALVERVRAVAMAENRPATPGTASHIDWAGDDDDTLPDLNDWGVTTATTNTDQRDEISPISVDGLKPLPEPIAFAPEIQDTPYSVQAEILTVQKDIPQSSQSAEKLHNGKSVFKSPILSKASVEQDALPASSKPAVVIPATKNSAQDNQPKENGRALSRKTPRHPLPPKPIVVVDAPLASSKLPPAATPMRGKFTKTSAEKVSKQVDTVTVQPPTPRVESEEPVIVKLPEQGLGQSIHAPTVGELAEPKAEDSPEPQWESGSFGNESSPSEGLIASMHAPKLDDSLSASIHAPRGGESLSAPGSATFDSFKPTHVRAHTVGRPPYYNGPQRFSRSAVTSPRSAFAPHHARNHSSPPIGVQHRTHATRPVITGDAMSRLVRTLGTTMAPTRTPTVAAATKD